MPEISNHDPQLVQRRSGGWLAYSIRGHSLRIEVTGTTPDEAVQRYLKAVGEWCRNLASGSDVTGDKSVRADD